MPWGSAWRWCSVCAPVSVCRPICSFRLRRSHRRGVRRSERRPDLVRTNLLKLHAALASSRRSSRARRWTAMQIRPIRIDQDHLSRSPRSSSFGARLVATHFFPEVPSDKSPRSFLAPLKKINNDSGNCPTHDEYFGSSNESGSGSASLVCCGPRARSLATIHRAESVDGVTAMTLANATAIRRLLRILE
jgi:hypothetical protein